MTALRIPEQANTDLFRLASQGRSTRDLAEWLVETKQLEECSHMTVARRLHQLKLGAVAPADASREELNRLLSANEVYFEDVLESLSELEELATYGDPARKIAPNLGTAERLVRRRSQLIEARQQYLLERIEKIDRAERVARDKAMFERMNQSLKNDWADLEEEELQQAAPPPAPRAPVRAEPTPGRNAPCFCGSGKKYKKCHGSGSAVTAAVTAAVTPAVTPEARAAA